MENNVSKTIYWGNWTEGMKHAKRKKYKKCRF